MSGKLTCLRCGHEGHDVRTTLVAYDDPIPVTVAVAVSSRADALTEQRTVPGLYGAEWRCIDRPACDQRWAEQQPSSEPEQAAEPPAGDALQPLDEAEVAAFFAEPGS